VRRLGFLMHPHMRPAPHVYHTRCVHPTRNSMDPRTPMALVALAAFAAQAQAQTIAFDHFNFGDGGRAPA
jgi:hypothetical protein